MSTKCIGVVCVKHLYILHTTVRLHLYQKSGYIHPKISAKSFKYKIIVCCMKFVQTPTFSLILQDHVRYLKQFEGKGHLPVGSYGFQQAW